MLVRQETEFEKLQFEDCRVIIEVSEHLIQLQHLIIPSFQH